MTYRWIKSSFLIVALNAVLVLTSILHRQLTATVDSTSSTHLTSPIEAKTNDALASEGRLNPEVVAFQKLRDVGLAPNLATLEVKPVPEDDKLMAELRKKAAEAFPIMEGLTEPQSISSQTNPSSVSTTSTTRSEGKIDSNASAAISGLEDTPLTRRTSSIRELSCALEDLAKLSQDFERDGKPAESKVVLEQMLMVEKVMQELLKTPAF